MVASFVVKSWGKGRLICDNDTLFAFLALRPNDPAVA